MAKKQEQVECRYCGELVDKIDLFPKDLCFNCYRQTPDARQIYEPSLFTKSINIK